MSDTQTYNQAYKTLRESLEQLRRTDIANMDDLVPLVEQATAAYQVCKKRLETVEQMTKQSLSKADGT